MQGNLNDQQSDDNSLSGNGIAQSIPAVFSDENPTQDYELFYTALANQAADAFIIHDADGRFIEVNERACNSLGYSREELLTMLVTDVEQDISLDQARIKWKNFNPGDTLTSNGHHKRKDGSIFPVEVSFGCIEWKGQKFFTGFVRDITERKKSEEKVRKSKERLEDAEQFANMGSWEVDFDTGEVWWSPNMYRLFYRDPANVKPSLEEYLYSLHPDDRAIAREEIARMHRNEVSYMNEYRTNPELGKLRYLSPTVNVETDEAGNPVRFFGSMLDITRQRRSEEILRESEAKFRNVFEAANVGKSVTLVTGEMYVNQAFSDMLGYGREELQMKHWTEITPPEDVPENEKLLIPMVSGKQDSIRIIKRYIKKDGSYIWTDVSGVMKRDEKGSPLYYIATIIDISERIKAEQQLDALNRELEDRVKERTAQLESVNRELEAFSYSVSHDLRAPLRAINGYSQMLNERYSELLDEKGRMYLNNISKSAGRMDQLITDLLSLSQISNSEFEPVKVDMREVAETMYVDLTTEEERKQFEFIIGDLPSAYCDAFLIKHVWQNLISNALKYSSKSPVKRIEISGTQEKRQLVYAVKDCGAGFDSKYKDKLFSLFQRLHSHDFEGTGVGLAIVYRIITRHGGKVWAEGEIDKGATFYFSLSNKK